MQPSNLTIEDILIRLSMYSNGASSWNVNLYVKDSNIIYGLGWQVLTGVALTEKQAALSLKLLSKYSLQIKEKYHVDISELLKTPKYKYKLRKVDIQKKIYISTDKIIVSFNYDERLISEIRKYKNIHAEFAEHIIWNSSEKCWEFPLIEKNVLFIGNIFLKEKFTADDLFLDLYKKCSTMIEGSTKYTPYISFDTKPIFKNFHISNSNESLLESIFSAKRLAIKSYDQQFYNACKEQQLEKYIQLLSDNKQSVNDFDILSNIVKYNRTLFILSQGAELNSIKFIKKLIDSSAVDIKTISTLVRLKSNFDNGKKFNDFIKDNVLNNNLSEDTKIVIISDKLPKPLFSYLNFDFVIALSSTITNSYLRKYIQDHPGIICYNIYNTTLTHE